MFDTTKKSEKDIEKLLEKERSSPINLKKVSMIEDQFEFLENFSRYENLTSLYFRFKLSSFLTPQELNCTSLTSFQESYIFKDIRFFLHFKLKSLPIPLPEISSLLCEKWASLRVVDIGPDRIETFLFNYLQKELSHIEVMPWKDYNKEDFDDFNTWVDAVLLFYNEKILFLGEVIFLRQFLLRSTINYSPFGFTRTAILDIIFQLDDWIASYISELQIFITRFAVFSSYSINEN